MYSESHMIIQLILYSFIKDNEKYIKYNIILNNMFSHFSNKHNVTSSTLHNNIP